MPVDRRGTLAALCSVYLACVSLGEYILTLLSIFKKAIDFSIFILVVSKGCKQSVHHPRFS